MPEQHLKSTLPMLALVLSEICSLTVLVQTSVASLHKQGASVLLPVTANLTLKIRQFRATPKAPLGLTLSPLFKATFWHWFSTSKWQFKFVRLMPMAPHNHQLYQKSARTVLTSKCLHRHRHTRMAEILGWICYGAKNWHPQKTRKIRSSVAASIQTKK